MIPKDTLFLHLEDMTAIRELFKKDLIALGIETPPLEAENVAMAFKLVQENVNSNKKIQFIVSDWNLPDDTGLNFLKRIRQFQEFNSVPFVMATTENEITYMLDAINAGCSNYVVKPWNFNDFKEKIENSWGSKYAPPAGQQQMQLSSLATGTNIAKDSAPPKKTLIGRIFKKKSPANVTSGNTGASTSSAKSRFKLKKPATKSADSGDDLPLEESPSFFEKIWNLFFK
ncbi:MAG: response regulator [Oligoflexia bacterium]|nr:response regulator [Oligoflexia bacterium]MBF0366077.1 response regulator [Oligoflexia bacterium]